MRVVSTLIKKAGLWLLVAQLAGVYTAQAQKDTAQTWISTEYTGRRGVLFYLAPGASLPLGDMQYKANFLLDASAGAYWKTRSGWLFGTDFSYFFSEYPKEDPLKGLVNSRGTITGEDGLDINVTWQFRGMRLPYVKVGKIFARPKKLRCEDGSGWFWTLGGGYMLHWLFFQDVNRNLAQIQGEYEKGYDRLTTGAAFSQTFGWQFIDRARRGNFAVYLDFTQGLTQNRRFNFDQGGYNRASRLDMTLTLRLCYILPILERKDSDEYTY